MASDVAPSFRFAPKFHICEESTKSGKERPALWGAEIISPVFPFQRKRRACYRAAL